MLKLPNFTFRVEFCVSTTLNDKLFYKYVWDCDGNECYSYWEYLKNDTKNDIHLLQISNLEITLES